MRPAGVFAFVQLSNFRDPPHIDLQNAGVIVRCDLHEAYIPKFLIIFVFI